MPKKATTVSPLTVARKRLSDVRRRVLAREEALASSPRGKKTKAREALGKAKSALRKAESVVRGLEKKAAAQKARIEKKRAVLRARAEKAWQKYRDVEPEPEPIPDAPGGGAPPVTPYDADTLLAWLDYHGWNIYTFPYGGFWDASEETLSYKPGEIFELADLQVPQIAGVFYAARIVYGYRQELLDSSGRPLGSDDDGSGSLARDDGAVFQSSGDAWYFYRATTGWHSSDPAKIDLTVSDVCRNQDGLYEKRFGKPDMVSVTWFVSYRPNGVRPPRIAL